MNKVIGIGIAVLVIVVGIAVALGFDDTDKSNTEITQVGPFTVESSNEFSQEESEVGNDYAIILTEKVGVKNP